MEQKHDESMLSQKEFLDLSSSHSTDIDLVFDFSRIPNKKSDQVLASLVRYSKTNIRSLVICLDLYYEIYEMNSSFKPTLLNAQSLKNEPSALTKSAFRKDKTILQAIVIALKYILPRAEELQILEFRNIPFGIDQLSNIGKSLEKCAPLRSLSFDNVPLFDDGFQNISKSIKNLKLVNLRCRGCNLTDSSAVALKALLNHNANGRSRKSVNPKGNLCFQLLDLRYNSFSYRLLLEIGDVLSIIPLKVLDIRFNQLIDQKIAKNMRSVIRGLDVRVNTEKARKSKSKHD